MIDILKAAWFTPGLNDRWGLCMRLLGLPGAGKTSRISALARSCSMPLEVVLPGIRDPTDFAGLPIVQEDRSVKRMPVDSWCRRMLRETRGVVFFDEGNASEAVQNAMLRVLLEGAVGEEVLPPGIRFVLAMNSTEMAAGGHDLKPATANRLGHLRADDVDVDALCQYLLGGRDHEAVPLDPAAEEQRVMAAWPVEWARAVGLLTAFLRANRAMALRAPEWTDPAASGPWPSPRTWEMAARAMASSAVHGLSAASRDTFVASFVGDGAAIQWLGFCEQQDLPDPVDVLDGKVPFRHDPARLDCTAVVLATCAAFLAPQAADSPVAKAQRDGRAGVLWGIISGLADEAADLCIPPVQVLTQARLQSAPGGYAASAKLLPVLQAAGIVKANVR